MKSRLTCTNCQGEMQPYIGPRHSRKMGSWLMAGGLFSTLFWTGPVLGLPLLAAGAYMTAAKRKLWVCGTCNTAIERMELRMMPNTKVVKQGKSKPLASSPTPQDISDAEVVEIQENGR